ncbi:MAG: hypothetical protein H0S79_16485 [Anaerolineaceae bacterium]|nr:hypothetical protein [Anaerolineaceae bacterium]
MAISYPHQLESEFTSLLKPDETIAALGIFKKDPSISSLLLTRGITRFAAKEFHAAVTDQRLIVLAVHTVRGEKVVSNPIEAPLDEIQVTKNFFNEPVLVVPMPILEKTLTLRFKSGMQALGLNKYEFIGAIRQSTPA